MQSASGVVEASDDSETPWVEFLDKEIAYEGPDAVDSDIPRILRRALYSVDPIPAPEAARLIDKFYHNTYLLSNPLLRYQDDKGTAGFLNLLYELIYDLARHIPYNNQLQNVLVLLIVELRKLPPTEVKIWDETCFVYTTDPVYSSVLEDNWNGSYPPGGSRSTEQQRAAWINISAFFARCIQAGLNDHLKWGSRYAGIDIPKGLEEDQEPGAKENCFVWVAVNYLVLPGTKLHYEYLEKPSADVKTRQWALEVWPRWARKLGEIADDLQSESGLGRAAREAQRLMVSLEPEQLSTLRDATP